MNFTEIKESVIQQLSKLTVDDFGIKPNIINTMTFDGENDFQSFLNENHTNANYNYQMDLLVSEHSDLRNEIETIKKEIDFDFKRSKEIDEVRKKNKKEIEILRENEKDLNLKIQGIRKDLSSIIKAELTYVLVDHQKELARQEVNLTFEAQQLIEKIQ